MPGEITSPENGASHAPQEQQETSKLASILARLNPLVKHAESRGQAASATANALEGVKPGSPEEKAIYGTFDAQRRESAQQYADHDRMMQGAESNVVPLNPAPAEAPSAEPSASEQPEAAPAPESEHKDLAA